MEPVIITNPQTNPQNIVPITTVPDLENQVEVKPVEPKMHVVGSNAAVETLLNAEKTSARNDILKAIKTEAVYPALSMFLECAIWYLAEHAKHNQEKYQNQPYNQVNPVDDDWGQTILNFGLPIAIATVGIVSEYGRGRDATLGVIGTAAAAGAGAGFKALGFNNSLPQDNACRSFIHGGLGMIASSGAKAVAYLTGTRFGTFFAKPEAGTLGEHLISNDKNDIANTHYHKLGN